MELDANYKSYFTEYGIEKLFLSFSELASQPYKNFVKYSIKVILKYIWIMQ